MNNPFTRLFQKTGIERNQELKRSHSYAGERNKLRPVISSHAAIDYF
jgi:hypothetical protein